MFNDLVLAIWAYALCRVLNIGVRQPFDWASVGTESEDAELPWDTGFPVTMSASPPERIQTDRLVLRRLRKGDAETIFNGWASDGEVTRYLSWPTHDVIDHAIAYVSYALQAWEEGSDFHWMIEDGHGSVGGISFGVQGHRAVFGFVLRRSVWNKGYTTEALKVLVAWLDGQSEIRRYEACCSTENIGSKRVLEKAGFVCEGILRLWMVLPNISEKPQDMYMFARVR